MSDRMTAMLRDAQIWQTAIDGRSRYYMIPESVRLEPGPYKLTNRIGAVLVVSHDAIVPFEISEDQAHRWTRDQWMLFGFYVLCLLLLWKA